MKGAGDLDEANGRFGVTPEFPQGTYHYVLTENFPFIPRQFKGTPDSSFFRRGPPPMRFGAGTWGSKAVHPAKARHRERVKNRRDYTIAA